MGAVHHAETLTTAMNQLLAESEEIVPLWRAGTADAFLESYKVSKVPSFDEKWERLDPLSSYRLRYIRAHADDFEPSAR